MLGESETIIMAPPSNLQQSWNVLNGYKHVFANHDSGILNISRIIYDKGSITEFKREKILIYFLRDTRWSHGHANIT